MTDKEAIDKISALSDELKKGNRAHEWECVKMISEAIELGLSKELFQLMDAARQAYKKGKGGP